jgi:RNA polymerase sigma factor (sigma-70 family)
VDNRSIIEGCKQNDRKCQETLYKSHFSTMMNMCMRYVRDKDKSAAIVNDGFLKVFKKIDQFEYKGSFEGWIRRIVFHCMSDSIKKEASYVKFMVFDDYESELTSNNGIESLYEEDILKMIDDLPTASADVFILFAIKGYSHKEISELKNISIGTSKWHVSDSRKRLKELILNNHSYRSNAG